MALPKKFRKELGDQIILARWYEACLVIVSKNSWQGIFAKLTGKSEYLTRTVRDTDRFILSSAFEMELDSQGRFVVPKDLREYANLSEEVIFLGLADRVEIWSLDNWRERELFIRKHAEELVEKLARESRKAVNQQDT